MVETSVVMVIERILVLNFTINIESMRIVKLPLLMLRSISLYKVSRQSVPYCPAEPIEYLAIVAFSLMCSLKMFWSEVGTMRVAIIGGTGHIGSYLTPRPVEAGYSVVCISRGLKEPYQEHAAWRAIDRVEIDRTVEEEAGQFGEGIARLNAEIVIDLTCYHLESAAQLAGALRGKVEHLLHCGTIWVHGPSVEVPTTETQFRTHSEIMARESSRSNNIF
jgi:hypothetical protein